MSRKLLMRVSVAPLLALLCTACGATPETVVVLPPAEPTAVPFDVAGLNAVLHLAVEMEVTAEGVKPLGATVVRGPAKANSALADLQVVALADDKVVSEYVSPDPRLAEVDGGRRVVLERQETVFYAPLSADLSELQIRPVAGREMAVSAGGSVELRPLLRLACRERSDLAECQEILKELSGMQVMVAGKPFDSPLVQQAVLEGVPWAELAGQAFGEEDAPVTVQMWQGDVIQVDARGVTYAPQQAIELLAKAGYGQGLGLALIYAAGDQPLAVMARQVRAALEKVGASVEAIRVAEEEAEGIVAEWAGRGEAAIWLSR